ncbi:Phosphatidylinositol 4-phosphate 3-kinase C2 domain-containing subunit alpha [Lamellibrachia satsuma]|nr:Phosphatidylinositol 4-phosphate 3-kinase C2 domain-containing subunit alpha [Lamellibrachia satsuma]
MSIVLSSFCTPNTLLHSPIIHTDGKISSVEIYGYQKRYNPEKYYIYILKVDRVKLTMPSFVFRRYSEFQELHHKLLLTFSLARLPSLSGRVILGRTHVRPVFM